MDAYSLVRFFQPTRPNTVVPPPNFRPGSAPVILENRKETPEETKKLLNIILPPREFEEDGEFWIQYVSTVMGNISEGKSGSLNVGG